MPLSAGDKLGPYEIVALIGAGGMGEVYRARDPRLKRDVAIKVSAAQFSERFERAAQAIAALNHPNICQIYDVGPNYLVMEYIDGALLTGPLRLEQGLQYAVQIASALEVAHQKNIVHRDLKLGNILLTGTGVKVLDFGLAKVSEAKRPAGATQNGRPQSGSAQTGSAQTMSLTEAGTILGTAAYMSPEQAKGEDIDARSDIFSFGVVLYEMLSGRQPFAANSFVETISATLRDEPTVLDAPANVSAIVTRCLRKSPVDRFQTISEVRAALERAIATPGEKTPSIAVLPFANMGGDQDNEYFSDGLAEEIINFLAQIPGLKVTARTSAFAFKGKTEDIRKIAETLGVAVVLEGSVRRSGSRLRVTAQLINARDGYHLWSQRYDRQMADLFDLQDEIAQAIASALHVKLSGAPAPYKPSLPAYEALLKARYYYGTFRPDLLPQAKECFEQAIALDPKFTLAHCEHGNYFWGMALAGALPANQALPRIRTVAEKALELDASLSDAHAMSGMVAACLEYDWKEAERRFRLALSRDPVTSNVRLYYSLYLLLVGRPAEAVQQTERGLHEDPLNLLLQNNRAAYLSAAGRDAEAAEALREVLELNPTLVLSQLALAGLHASRGEFDQAMALCRRAYTAAPLPSAIGWLAGLLQRGGDTPAAEELLGKLQPSDAFGVPRALSVYHWILAEFDAQAEWLEKAIDQHDPYGLIYLRIWYGRELRSTPHWARLMRKLNLPES
jgi:serine/threonine protein kinase/Tfp pilus assembly protein PilF